MARLTKLENQVQEKLNSREIQPSAQALDRLDAMLAVAEEKKISKKPIFSFRNIGVAASLLLGIFLVNQYNQESSTTKFKIPNQPKASEVVDNPIETPKTDNQISVTSKNQIVYSTPIHQKATHQIQHTKRVSISNQKQINSIVEVISKKQEIPKPFISQEVIVSNQKNVVAEVEIPTKKETSIAKIKVNATSLLSQVDGELNQTYRETKLEKIARNFNSVKVALANRNNQ